MAKGIFLRTRLRESSSLAVRAALDSYNSGNNPYRKQQALILMANALELLAKAILLKKRLSIYPSGRATTETVSGEVAFSRLKHHREVDDLEAQTVQQVISLRNEAIHSFMPPVPHEVMHHLMYSSTQVYKKLFEKHFKAHADFEDLQLLSISFGSSLTYADKVEGLLKGFRKSGTDARKLGWLLARGVAFVGTKYMSQSAFEAEMRRSSKPILDRTKLGEYVKSSDQVKVVFIQAPRGSSANVEVSKGARNQKEAVAVMTKKTEVEIDYPYLTKDLALKLNRNIAFVAKTVQNLKMQDDGRYHQAIRSSTTGARIQKYSDAALSKLKDFLQREPEYNPFK